ncbi:MAG: hypothetical protein JWM80_2812 [Cyanobacteria bacterium RYN_339]|nr:hypothetical protein [Cyanobacteria bacterium RYN_339]
MRKRKGSMLLVLAGGLPALLGMAGMVVDYGNAAWQQTRLQAVMDAAALAGGQDLPNTTLAGNAAARYVQENGEDPGNMAVTYSHHATRITVAKTKLVHTWFLGVLGIPAMQVAATATGELRGPGGAFDYAIFAGSQDQDLPLAGNGFQVYGGIHANRNLILDGAGWLITRAAEAVGTVTAGGSAMDIGSFAPNAAPIALPDYSAAIAAKASSDGNAYQGNWTMRASDFVMQALYVRGDVTATGRGYASTGVLLADGTITLAGSGQLVNDHCQVCFYSKDGDVVLNGNDLTLSGVLYAPHGRVIVNGDRVTINGCVVGQGVVVNGEALTVDREDHEVRALHGRHVRLVRA